MSKGIAIPREQVIPIVERIGSLIGDRGRSWEMAGSYRRGCAEVHDLDMVVDDDCYRSVVSVLLDADLAPIRLKKDNSVVGFIWQLEDAPLRIELYRAKPGKFFEMLLFGTGSGAFNIRQRAHAKKMGMKLSQNGLFRNGGLVECDSEEAIFRELEMNYLSPDERSE